MRESSTGRKGNRVELNRRSDYACRIIRAAYRSGDSYVSVSEVAEAEEIPYAFARSIQHDLVHAGLLKTVRGAKGGLALACDPSTTTLLDVLEALQGPMCMALCSADPSCCARSGHCEYSKVWRGADELLRSYFGAITLTQLFEHGCESDCASDDDDAR